MVRKATHCPKQPGLPACLPNPSLGISVSIQGITHLQACSLGHPSPLVPIHPVCELCPPHGPPPSAAVPCCQSHGPHSSSHDLFSQEVMHRHLSVLLHVRSTVLGLGDKAEKGQARPQPEHPVGLPCWNPIYDLVHPTCCFQSLLLRAKLYLDSFN